MSFGDSGEKQVEENTHVPNCTDRLDVSLNSDEYTDSTNVDVPANDVPSIEVNDDCYQQQLSNVNDSHEGDASISGMAKDDSPNVKKNLKRRAWYSAFNSTYKKRATDFHRLFPEIPISELLIVDYSCALQREIFAHGRMYISSLYICFYSNIMGWEAARICIPCKSIVSITKEKTAIVIPNAIEVKLRCGERYFFASFASRDKTYLTLFRIWQNCLLDQLMSQSEIIMWVKQCYGSDFYGDLNDDTDGNNAECDQALDDSLTKNDFLCSYKEVDSVKLMRHKFSPLKKSYSINDNLLKFTENEDPSHENDTDLSNSENGSIEYDIAEDVTDIDKLIMPPKDSAQVTCGCESHLSQQLLHQTYDLSLDYLFECVFTNTTFSADYYASRKIHIEEESPWTAISNTENMFTRSLTYSVISDLKILGSCVIKSTETQILKRSPDVITVNTEVNNTNVPYADKFYILTRFCLTAEGESKTTLRITSSIEYRKNVWALTKSLIHKNSMQAMQEAFNDLDRQLQCECKKYDGTYLENCPEEITVGSETRKRSSSIIPFHGLQTLQQSSVKSMLIVILIAILFDGFLYWKLRNLENNSVQMSGIGESFSGISKHCCDDKLKELLQIQNDLQRQQLNILTTFVNETMTVLLNLTSKLELHLRLNTANYNVE
ncbi:hypothetical protein GJ496_000971 [Pomphorhynchus laevis]|nr:hypothetical protein GJ496_000971 [Pomphorhynchus laevis]